MKTRKAMKCNWNESPGCDINTAHTPDECYKPMERSDHASEAKHTPTPWKVGNRETIYTEDLRVLIAGVGDDDIGEAEQKANAAFIVRAVNAHEELLDILRDVYSNLQYGHEIVVSSEWVERTEKAIAKAEGK